MTALEEVFRCLARAGDEPRSARSSRAGGEYRPAVAVAYRAAFAAARAVLALHRHGAKTHSGVASQFYRLAAFDPDFPETTAAYLSQLGKERGSAAYDMTGADRDWREEEATGAIERATMVVGEVQAWLERHRPDDFA